MKAKINTLKNFIQKACNKLNTIYIYRILNNIYIYNNNFYALYF